VIKSRRVRWAGRVAPVRERRDVFRILVGTSEGKCHLKDPGVDVRIILRWMFREWDVGAWTGLIWLRIGTGGRNL